MIAALLSSPLAHGQQEGTPDLSAAAQGNPAVAAVLDMPRETPAETLTAVFTLIDLGEIQVAQQLLEPLLESELSKDEKAALVDKFGTARFLKLARPFEPTDEDTPASIPEAFHEFAKSCLNAAAEVAQEPERLEQLIRKLTSGSAADRRAARSDLAATGSPAAKACLEALAQAEEEEPRKQLMVALVQMRPVVDPMLIAALSDGEGQFLRDVVELVGHLHLLEATPWLAAMASGAETNQTVVDAAQTALMKMGLPLPDPIAARAAVLRELERVEAGVPTAKLGQETYTWHSFSIPNKEFVRKEVSPAIYRHLQRARLSKILLSLPNATTTDRQLALLSAEQVSHDLGEPLAEEIIELKNSLSVSQLSDALSEAMDSNWYGGALAIIELLGDRRDPAAIHSYDTQPGPLAEAVSHPHRKIRFAALQAVMSIDPEMPFPGSSNVAPALWFFASGVGPLQAITGSPSRTRASDWAGELRGLDYDATPTSSGRHFLHTAASANRLAMLLVDSEIGNPVVREVLFQLRAYPPTARTPIAVLCSNTDLETYQQLAESDPQLIATSRPHNSSAMEVIATRLSELRLGDLSSEVRKEQARAALTWLAEILRGSHPYDELLRGSDVLNSTVFQPGLTEPTLQVLAQVGNSKSQQTLLEFASLVSQPIELRRQAVEAFRQSHRQFGNQLTAGQLARQYDRYNASETADSETQQVLSELLDILERKQSQ